MGIRLSNALMDLDEAPDDHFIGGEVPTHEELDGYSGCVPDGDTAPCHEGIVAMFAEADAEAGFERRRDMRPPCPDDHAADLPTETAIIRETLTEVHPLLIEVAEKLFGDIIIKGHRMMYRQAYAIALGDSEALMNLIAAMETSHSLSADRRQLLANYRDMLDQGVRRWDGMEEEILEVHLTNIIMFAIGCAGDIVRYMERLPLSQRSEMLTGVENNRFTGLDRYSAASVGVVHGEFSAAEAEGRESGSYLNR